MNNDPEQQRPTSRSSPSASNEEPYTLFGSRQRALIVLIVSTAATISGLASNIYFPALPTIAHDLHVTPSLINLSITVYLIFQGLAPSLWGPISDVKGRRIAYIGTFVVFLGACVGPALAKSYGALMALRCLQSAGSASTIAIGAGVIGDITMRESWGGYMGGFQAGLLVPVAVNPVIGGALADSLGWHSIFWFLTIYCGVFLVVLVLALPETLRSLVGNGALPASGVMARYPLRFYQCQTAAQRTLATAPAAWKNVDIFATFRILVSTQAAIIILYLAIYYAVWQMSITAMSTLFSSTYGLSDTQIGLTYIVNGVGSMIGTLITGKLLDIDFRRYKARNSRDSNPKNFSSDGDTPANLAEDPIHLQRARLRLVAVFSLLQCASIAIFGWTIHAHVHIAVPIICTFVTGWCAVSTQSAVMTYLVDVFPDRSAAASASLNLARCLLASGGTSFVMPLVEAVGVGWAFTACVGVQLTALLSVIAFQWKSVGTQKA